MVAAVGIALIEDDAHVTRLARGVKAEIVELLHHLALVDVLIQAALGVRAAVLAEGIGQLCEVVLGLAALRPALIDIVDRVLGLLLVVIGIRAVAVAVLGLDEDMADIDGIIGIIIAALEEHDVVAAVLLLHDGHVIGVAVGAVEPVGVHGGAEARALGVGIVRDARRSGRAVLGLLGGHVCRDGGSEAVRIMRGGGDLVGRGLGGRHRGVRGLGRGVAVVVRGIFRVGLDEVVLIVERIVAVLVLGVARFDLLGRVGVAIVLLLRILRGKLAHLEHVAHDLLGHAVAVGRLEILADGVVLILLGSELDVGKLLVDLVLVVLVERDAGLLGGIAQRRDLHQILLSSVPEIIVPGVKVVADAALLLIERLAGVQLDIGQIVAVLVAEREVGRAVGVIDLGRGILHIADLQRGARGVKEAGVAEQNGNDEQHDNDRADRPLDLALLALFGFLLRGDLAALRAQRALICAALLVLGCTHS